ncbi:MAG TPA: ABC transporter permease [Gaiellaceae bacterium]|nr:ABC transporter permease [Gaiellaceae bacterium]
MRRWVANVAQLTRRSLLRTARQPGSAFFALVFPLVFLAVIASGLSPADRLPGFPDATYLDVALAIPFVQGALFVSSGAATELARDIESGFLNRLALTPASGAPLVLGHLGAAVVIGVVQASVYLTAGLVAGADFRAGPLGVVVLFALASLIALAFGALGTAVALRTGSSEAVQGMFPLFFVALFLSSMNLPRNLIEADWFRAVATANPVSYLIEGIRSLIVEGWDAQALALGFGVGIAMVAGALALSRAAFRERLSRT